MTLTRSTLLFVNALLLLKARGNTKKPDVKSNQLSLPDFKNLCEVKSSVNGRVRFFIPLLKGNEAVTNSLVEQLKQIPVIDTISANIVTGSLVIKYRSDAVDGKTLQGAVIKLLGLDKELLEGRNPVIGQKLKDLGDAMNSAVYDSTKGLLDFKTAAALLLVLTGLYDLYRYKRNPGYPTLFWWGSTLLFRS